MYDLQQLHLDICQATDMISLKNKSRERNLVIIRHLFMYFAAEKKLGSYNKIAEFLGYHPKYGHAAVSHGVKKYKVNMEYDKELRVLHDKVLPYITHDIAEGMKFVKCYQQRQIDCYVVANRETNRIIGIIQNEYFERLVLRNPSEDEEKEIRLIIEKIKTKTK